MPLTRCSYMRFLTFLMWFFVAWYSFQATCQLEEEVTTNTFEEPPGLLMLCYVVPPTDVGEVEVPMRTRTCECEAAPVCVEDFISLVFLFEWPVANSQYNVTCEEINLYFFLSTVTKMLCLAFGGSAEQVCLHILWRIVLRRKRGRVSAEVFGRVF